jgi:hypothetical protein
MVSNYVLEFKPFSLDLISNWIKKIKISSQPNKAMRGCGGVAAYVRNDKRPCQDCY